MVRYARDSSNLNVERVLNRIAADESLLECQIQPRATVQEGAHQHVVNRMHCQIRFSRIFRWRICG